MASKSRPSAGPHPVSVSISAAMSAANDSPKGWKAPNPAGSASAGPPPPGPPAAHSSRPPRRPDRPPEQPHQRFDLPLDGRPHRLQSPLFRRRGSGPCRRGGGPSRRSGGPSRSQPGIAQLTADLDKLPRQVPETAVRRDLRPHLGFRRRGNVPRHRLPRPLPRQQKLRMAGVPRLRAMTARRPAPPKPPPQRTGTHRSNRRHLTQQLCAAPFQNIDLYFGHRAESSS